MLKWKDFGIGGYNFDDYTLVKELYIPTNVGASTKKTLHDRSRDNLEHYLQHYAIPTDKIFIAIKAVVQMSQNAVVGQFGTATRYLAQGAPADWVIGGTYWCGGTGWGTLVVGADGIVYECKSTHTGSAAKEPPNDTYWLEGSAWAAEWGDDKYYFQAQIVTVEVEGVSGSYRCISDHTSVPDTEPGETDWETVWTAGDEFIADRTISRFYLNVSEGHKYQIGVDAPAIFYGFVTGSNTMGRWLEAQATGSSMLAGGILYGIEVEAE